MAAIIPFFNMFSPFDPLELTKGKFELPDSFILTCLTTAVLAISTIAKLALILQNIREETT